MHDGVHMLEEDEVFDGDISAMECGSNPLADDSPVLMVNHQL